MAKIRSISDITRKWVTVTPQRAPQYEAGVRAPLNDWATGAAAAESNFEQGVQAAVARKAFGKGVSHAGTETWQKQSIGVGVSRWGQGVSQAGGNYQEGFEPFRATIESTTLPPRFPRGDTRNYERGRAIGEALHKAKTGV